MLKARLPTGVQYKHRVRFTLDGSHRVIFVTIFIIGTNQVRSVTDKFVLLQSGSVPSGPARNISTELYLHWMVVIKLYLHWMIV